MLEVTRNKITLEDVDKNSEVLKPFNAGLLSTTEVEDRVNASIVAYATNAIYTAIETVKARLSKYPPEKRPALTYAMVKDELGNASYNVLDKVLWSFEQYKLSKYYKCDGTCGNFDLTIPEIMPRPVLTPAEELEVEAKDIPATIPKFIRAQDNNEQLASDTKYLAFFTSMYNSLDFRSLLPDEIAYDGFYSASDGGEGTYFKLPAGQTSYLDIGTCLKIKGIYFKRKYSGTAYGAWFGLIGTREISQEMFHHLICDIRDLDLSNLQLYVTVTNEISTNQQLKIRARNTSITVEVPQETPLQCVINYGHRRLEVGNIEFNLIMPAEQNTTVMFMCDELCYETLRVNNSFNTYQKGAELLATNGNYELPLIEFDTLPVIEASTSPDALATYDDVKAAIDTRLLLTTDTVQEVPHSYSIGILPINEAKTNIVVKQNSAKYKEAIVTIIKGLIDNYIPATKLLPGMQIAKLYAHTPAFRDSNEFWHNSKANIYNREPYRHSALSFTLAIASYSNALVKAPAGSTYPYNYGAGIPIAEDAPLSVGFNLLEITGELE